MFKGSKLQYKRFEITKMEDALLVLSSLIVPVTVDLEKFNRYSAEAITWILRKIPIVKHIVP